MNTTSIHKVKGWNKYLDPKETNIRSLYSKYKNSAKKRDLEFDLNLNIFRFFIFENCNYCGVLPSKIHNRYLDLKGNRTWTARKNNITEKRVIEGKIIFNGIDRIDNTKGYTPGNCVTCCYTCNQAKHNMTHQAFMSWLARIANHWNKGPLG